MKTEIVIVTRKICLSGETCNPYKKVDSFKFGFNLVFTFLFNMKSKDFESRKAKQQFALSYLGTYTFKLCVIFFESFLHL